MSTFDDFMIDEATKQNQELYRLRQANAEMAASMKDAVTALRVMAMVLASRKGQEQTTEVAKGMANEFEAILKKAGLM